MKTLSLLKAALSQDMNMFKYKTAKNSSKLTKLLFPVFLFIIVCFSIGVYTYMIAEKLHPFNLTYIMLTIIFMTVTLLTFMSGIYKSQGILFEAKDNDLLFSLPIPKSKISFVRVFKLLAFQYIYNLMFILPAIVTYIYFEHPSISFYLISFLMTFLIPIIPTIISSAIGYLIKLFSSKSQFKKIVQTLLSAAIFMVIFFASDNMNNFLQEIVVYANSINEAITKIYYPLGLYINLITDFNVLDLIKILLVNLIPFIIFIMLGAKYYFKIISNSKETSTTRHKKSLSYKNQSPIKSLTIKEIKRYFSSPTYMFNSSFGLLLVLVLTIGICLRGPSIMNSLLQGYQLKTDTLSLPILFYGLIFFGTAMTSISSSSISLEGKTINITKSLPIKETTILNSKILMCLVIEMPFILLSELIFDIVNKPSLFYIIVSLILPLVIITLNANIGLLVNLKYPKLNASNDTEVVKQSMSSMISVFTGMMIGALSLMYFIHFSKYLSITNLIILNLVILTIIDITVYLILMKIGPKKYRDLNV